MTGQQAGRSGIVEHIHHYQVAGSGRIMRVSMTEEICCFVEVKRGDLMGDVGNGCALMLAEQDTANRTRQETFGTNVGSEGKNWHFVNEQKRRENKAD